MTSSSRVTVKEVSDAIKKLKEKYISEIKLRKEKVKYHKITLHKGLEQNEFLIKQPKNNFKCKRCQERFQSENVLRNHKVICQSKIIERKVCTKMIPF